MVPVEDLIVIRIRVQVADLQGSLVGVIDYGLRGETRGSNWGSTIHIYPVGIMRYSITVDLKTTALNV